MASPVTICNRGLQKLGARRITSLSEDSANARACNVAYESLRDAELRSHPWSFAKRRVILAADVNTPVFGSYTSFILPADFLGLRDADPFRNYPGYERQIEGRNLLTRENGTLELIYTARVEDVNSMDALFQELLATKIAFELCEELTQSNTKKEGLREDYEQILRKAKRINAIERESQIPPEDDWITGRN